MNQCMKRDIKCPNCGSEEISEYMIGRPVNIDDPRFIYIGCFERKNVPSYHCNSCHMDYDENMELWEANWIQKLVFVCKKFLGKVKK